MIKGKRFFVIMASALFVIMGAGNASAFLYDLTVPNDTGLPEITYATVNGSVDGSDSSSFHFMVDIPSDLKTTLNGGSNFGMDKFYFNTDLTLTASMFENFDPSTWDVFKIGGSNVAGFGSFSIQVKDNDRTESLSFDINYGSPVTEQNFDLLSTGNAGNGNGNFAAHIGGFDYGGFGSVQVRNGDGSMSVPESSTMLLLGSSLFGLIFYNRKIRKEQ